MSKLSDTQAILLSAACQRPDGNLLPLPGSLRGGAATKVVAALLSRGFAAEQVRQRSEGRCRAEHLLAQRGRRPRRPAAYHRRRAGRSRDRARQRHCGAAAAGEAARGRERPPRPAARPPQEPLQTRGPRQPREGTKQAPLVGLLSRAEGATIAEIVAATGWQPHTVRGAFAGALKKRLGLTIVSEKVEGRGRVYRIGA